MLDFISDVGRFALQTTVIVVAILVIIAFIASLISKQKSHSDLTIKNINKKFRKNKNSLLKFTLDKKELKKLAKQQKAESKENKKQSKVFVVDFEGDIKASAVDDLREEISAILMVADKDDRVIVKLESPGGMVHGYGLAASQLQRLKDKGIPLTVCVDKVAASGGYMMACIADKIVAAPFAIIGSIGVVASMPNFNKVLKKNDVEYLEITAGEFKRTLTPLGEITEPGMKKFKEQIEQVHVLFKDHVATQRPRLDISRVATGEYWYGQQALSLDLVDEIGTSDDLLLRLSNDHTLLSVKHSGKKTLKEKLGENLSFQLESLQTKVASLLIKSHYL